MRELLVRKVKESIGLVAFSQEQQDNIEDALSLHENGNNLAITPAGVNSTGQAIFKAGTYERMRVTNGGFTQFGTSSSGSFVAKVNITNTGELNRPERTAQANLLPLCYGRVYASGTIDKGTGNFTVTKSATGDYKITLPSEGSLFLNQNRYMIFANANQGEVLTSILSDNTIHIRTRKYNLITDNKNCSCLDLEGGFFSVITSSLFSKAEDDGFSFMIFKL